MCVIRVVLNTSVSLMLGYPGRKEHTYLLKRRFILFLRGHTGTELDILTIRLRYHKLKVLY